MRETQGKGSGVKLTADIVTLMQMLSVGRATAEAIGNEAHAVIKIGRRRLYNVDKIRAYLNAVSE